VQLIISMKDDIITMGHGSGAGLTQQLIREVFDSEFQLPSYEDSIQIEHRTVVTTDAYVVKPLFFPGGDIGRLSVTGTVNDLCMSGGRPAYIMASFILEEGFKIALLQKIVNSMQKAAEEAGIRIIAGDTKVVERGKCDGIYITTSGIGFLPAGVELSAKMIRVGDRILVNGTIGDHSVAIMNARQNLELEPAPVSDSAPLHEIIQILLGTGGLRYARDATRGGVATILNEVISEKGLGIIIDEKSLPVKEATTALCGLLGLDPLYLANEGKLIAFLSPGNDDLLEDLNKHKYGKGSAFIGEVTEEVQGVYLRTAIGTLRPLLLLASDPLPRIC